MDTRRNKNTIRSLVSIVFEEKPVLIQDQNWIDLWMVRWSGDDGLELGFVNTLQTKLITPSSLFVAVYNKRIH